MLDWKWLDKRLLITLHNESLSLHGGAAGIRNEGLLDSAVNRTPNLALYGTPDYAELAAVYGVGLAKNHAFVDGNKRVAFLSMGLFLMINGWRLKATQVDATLIMLSVASGEVGELELAAWIRRHSIAR